MGKRDQPKKNKKSKQEEQPSIHKQTGHIREERNGDRSINDPLNSPNRDNVLWEENNHQENSTGKSSILPGKKARHEFPDSDPLK